MIRLVCIDVDGTLIGRTGDVLPSVWEAAARARARGVRLALCTGRPSFGVTGELARRLDPDGWHVFQNGASVVSLGTGESRSTPLPDDAVPKLLELRRATGRTLELYADGAYGFEGDVDVGRAHAALLGIPFTPRGSGAPLGPVVRAQWLHPKRDAAAAMAEAWPGLEASASTSPLMPETVFVGLTRAGVSKASAIRTVAAALGVELADVMMVGDSQNDVGAMRVVGHPVAMGNSEPSVLAVARSVVGHVDRGGLAEALDLAR